MFATLLAYCEPNNSKVLWKKFKNAVSDDYLKLDIKPAEIRIKVLQYLRNTLESMGKDINECHLVDFDINLSKDERYMKEINEELSIDVSEQDIVVI